MSKNKRKLMCGTCGSLIPSSGEDLLIPDFLKKSPKLIEETQKDTSDSSHFSKASSSASPDVPEDPQGNSMN